jgi:hypothetical protein
MHHATNIMLLFVVTKTATFIDAAARLEPIEFKFRYCVSCSPAYGSVTKMHWTRWAVYVG